MPALTFTFVVNVAKPRQRTVSVTLPDGTFLMAKRPLLSVIAHSSHSFNVTVAYSIGRPSPLLLMVPFSKTPCALSVVAAPTTNKSIAKHILNIRI